MHLGQLTYLYLPVAATNLKCFLISLYGTEHWPQTVNAGSSRPELPAPESVGPVLVVFMNMVSVEGVKGAGR